MKLISIVQNGIRKDLTVEQFNELIEKGGPGSGRKPGGGRGPFGGPSRGEPERRGGPRFKTKRTPWGENRGHDIGGVHSRDQKRKEKDR